MIDCVSALYQLAPVIDFLENNYRPAFILKKKFAVWALLPSSGKFVFVWAHSIELSPICSLSSPQEGTDPCLRDLI